MPNESVPICGCGVALDLPKSIIRNGNLIPNKNSVSSAGTAKTSSVVSKCRDNRVDRKALYPRVDEAQIVGQGGTAAVSASAGCGNLVENGSTSSVQNTEQQWRVNEKHNNGKQGKRLNSSRRTRSAERPDTHYTYIDSGSSVAGNGIRDNVIPEALYTTVNGPSNRTANPNLLAANNQPSNGQNNSHSQPVYAIPSMTSPPPTYDVAMWQSGLPPSYEEYLCHKYAVISRSHTPPPPWSDSTLQGNGQLQSRREILASQPDLREYLSQLAKAHAQVQAQAQAQAQAQSQSQSQNNNQTSSRQQLRILRESTSASAAAGGGGGGGGGTVANSNSQISRDQAARSQRARTTISRSQSESRARQQRIATMYEDGAFCMETTAIQSAFEHGVAFCSLM